MSKKLLAACGLKQWAARILGFQNSGSSVGSPGHDRQFLADAPIWLNEVAGGWSLSGIPIYRTGNVLNVFSDAYVAGYANNAPAISIGQSKNDLRSRVNKQNGSSFDFANSKQVFSDFEGPVGLEIEQRNDFRGPGALSFDAGVAKLFPLLRGDRLNLKFRADAFNVLNHSTYAAPYLNIASSSNFVACT